MKPLPRGTCSLCGPRFVPRADGPWLRYDDGVRGEMAEPGPRVTATSPTEPERDGELLCRDGWLRQAHKLSKEGSR
jgi:hypothetical protein